MVFHPFLLSALGMAIGAGARVAIQAARRRSGAEPALPPNVECGENGKLRPAPGYAWVSAAEGDFAVRWSPGRPHPERRVQAGPEPGHWHPAPGYVWARPDDPASMEVRWHPGSPHPTAPHVVASEQERTWCAAPGYRWCSRDPDDLRVERTGGPAGETGSFDAARLQRIKDLAILGLSEGAGWAEVEAAFRRLVKVHHPDRFAGAAADAIESARQAFLLLRQAYDRLKAAGG